MNIFLRFCLRKRNFFYGPSIYRSKQITRLKTRLKKMKKISFKLNHADTFLHELRWINVYSSYNLNFPIALNFLLNFHAFFLSFCHRLIFQCFPKFIVVRSYVCFASDFRELLKLQWTEGKNKVEMKFAEHLCSHITSEWR